MQKLSVYTVQGLRYMLWYADQKIAVDACMCKVSSNNTQVHKSNDPTLVMFPPNLIKCHMMSPRQYGCQKSPHSEKCLA